MLPLIIMFFIALGLLYHLKKYFEGGICNNRKDITGKFIIITGASSGIGKEAAKDLLNSGAEVVFACRDEKKTNDVINSISASLKPKAHFIKLDLCDFSSIINFSKEIKLKFPKIDILMNNAGAHPREMTVTKDGYESILEGNYLGMTLLTFLLLDHFNNDSKILITSSYGHGFPEISERIISNLANNQFMKKRYYSSLPGKVDLYCLTKLLQIYFTKYFAEVLSEKYTYIKVAALHPGGVVSGFQRNFEDYKFLNVIYRMLMPLWWFIWKMPVQGCQTMLQLSYMDFNELCSGAYYSDCKVKKLFEKGRDDKMKELSIKWTLEQLKKIQGLDLKL